MRSLLRLAGALAILGIAMTTLVDLRPWRPPDVTIRSLQHAEGTIRAGAGKAPVDLPREIPLAGFRPFGRAATGEGEPVYARTLLLESGGVRTGIVLLELMTLPASLSERIRRQLQAEGVDCALVAASHTHSGPGAYDRAFLPQAVAIGRFDPRVETALVDAVHASLIAARSELTEARLFAGEARANLAKNRDREGAPTDDRLGRIEVRRADGTRIASLLRVAAHPTIGDRAGLSGDWPGRVMARLEEGGGIGFVLQGAAGDAMVEGEREVARFGARVLRAAEGVEMEGIDEPPALGCRLAEFALPPPDLSAMVTGPIGRFASNVATPFAPKTSQVVELRLGRISLLGVPGEPTAAVGRRLEAVTPSLRTIGLAGDYAGYLVEAADMKDRVFSARNAWFGAELTERVAGVAERLFPAAIPASEGWPEEATAR